MRWKAAIALASLFTLLALLWVGYFVLFPAPQAKTEGDLRPRAKSGITKAVDELLGKLTPPPPAASPPPKMKPAPPLRNLDEQPTTMAEQRADLFTTLQSHFDLEAAAVEEMRQIFAESNKVGQGDPRATEHPLTKRQCLERRAEAGLEEPFHPRCGRRNMLPIFNPQAGETATTAPSCIDAFEFPGIPCEYPVTWVSARQAALLCKAVGKRLCDAHEWEGACGGQVLPPEEAYVFGVARKTAKHRINEKRRVVWSYGTEKDHKKCGTGSKKSEKCGDGGRCGSNAYPAGSFPECKSPFGVFDLHGNAAEHMNLPTKPDELTSRGGTGVTEMKGSWFIFDSYEAHEDDCYWRAPDWHATDVMDVNSHGNYHLGFRCCLSVE